MYSLNVELTTELKALYKAVEKLKSNTIRSKNDVTNNNIDLTVSKIEVFRVLFLDNGNNIIGQYQVEGTVNRCSVYQQELFRSAILNACSSMILIHNHPSGATDPSESDWKLTKDVCTIAKILGMEVLDHVIITPSNSISMREDARW